MTKEYGYKPKAVFGARNISGLLRKKQCYKSEEYGHGITELFVSVCVSGSHPAPCVPRVMTGACTEAKVSSSISSSSSLLFPSVSCTLSSRWAMPPATGRSWFNLNQHTGRKREKQTNSKVILDSSSVQKKTPEALMKFWLINFQCTIISLCEDSEKYWEYFISKSKKNLLKCAKNIHVWG